MVTAASRMSSAARVAIAGVLTVLLVACGRDSPEQLLASAKDYLAKGDRNAAVIQLKNLLNSAPNNGEARLMLGQALLDAQDFVSAEKELGRALELKQPHEKVLPPYTRALFALGRYQDVIAEVEKYRLFNPPAVAATQTTLGDAYRQLGNAVRAKAAYAAALAAVPGYSRARHGEAVLIAAEGRLDEALKATDEVIAADPKLVEARAFRADILLAQGDRAGARKAFEAAIESDAGFLPARLALIGLLTDGREFDSAGKLLDETRKIAPRDLRVNYLDASLAFRRGELDRARQQVQQVLKYLPDEVPSLVLAGAIELQSKRYTGAEIFLSKAVARAPGHLGARRLLVQTYLGLGQPGRAREALQPIVDRGMPMDARLQLLAGETYLASGDTKRAATFFQQAAKGSEDQRVAARTRLGQIALATGRVEEGFKELEAASELDASGYQADLALVAGHLRRKEFDKAFAAVKAMEKKQPKNPLTFQMYGVVTLAKNDVEAARRNFEKALELQSDYLAAAYNLAQLDVLAKKPEDARKRYESMIAKHPNNEQLLVALAELMDRTGASPKDVEATLRRAVAASPQAPGPRMALIDQQLRTGNAKAALTAAQEAVAVLPSDPRVLEAAGVAQEAAGETNQAIETYNRLAVLQPQAVRPLYQLAMLYVRQQETDKAIEALRRVQRIVPGSREATGQIIQLYMLANRHDEAFKEVREFQKREPTFAGAYSLEGDVYVSQRKLVEAERAYREALRLEPKANAVAIRLHGVLAGSGKAAEASSFAKKWISDNPKDVAMRRHLGQEELRVGNLKAAAAHYQAALTINPNDELTLNNLAWIAGQLGDPKAIEYGERALKLAPKNPAVLDTVGMLYLRKGDVAKGLPLLERAIGLAPSRHDLRLNFAKALVTAGRKDDARRELESLAKVTDSFAGKDEIAGLLKGL